MHGKGRAAGQQQKSVGASGSDRRKHMSQQSNNKSESKGRNGSSNANRSRRSRAQGSSGRRGCTKNKNNAVHIVESGNFQSNYHAKLCTAAKYKVHAPLCSCPKVVKLRNQHQKQQQRAQQSDNDNSECAAAKNVINKHTSSNNNGEGYTNEIQFDIDGNIIHQLNRLDITANNNNTSVINNSNTNPFDNLVVLPDTKGFNPSIYICNNTNLHTFQQNGISV